MHRADRENPRIFSSGPLSRLGRHTPEGYEGHTQRPLAVQGPGFEVTLSCAVPQLRHLTPLISSGLVHSVEVVLALACWASSRLLGAPPPAGPATPRLAPPAGPAGPGEGVGGGAHRRRPHGIVVGTGRDRVCETLSAKPDTCNARGVRPRYQDDVITVTATIPPLLAKNPLV